MDEKDIRELQDQISAMEGLQNDLSGTIMDLLSQIGSMEQKLDESYNLSSVLSNLRLMVENIDVDQMFSFIPDLETEVNDLSHKYKKAEKANGISVYRILNQNVPMYFSPKMTKD